MTKKWSTLSRRIWTATAHKNQQGLEDIEELTGARLVAGLDALPNNVDHSRKKLLERFLLYMSTGS